jgi:hypothetical protein
MQGIQEENSFHVSSVLIEAPIKILPDYLCYMNPVTSICAGEIEPDIRDSCQVRKNKI